LGNAIRARSRDISFPDGKTCSHIIRVKAVLFLLEKVACPLFYFLFYYLIKGKAKDRIG